MKPFSEGDWIPTVGKIDLFFDAGGNFFQSKVIFTSLYEMDVSKNRGTPQIIPF